MSLGERMTPLLPLPQVGKALGVPGLLMKDEGSLPTGTFKARGAAIGVSRARELGIEGIVMPTNGNAGAAWAAYSARAGMRALVFMPVAAPRVTKDECSTMGASLLLVVGLIDDAGAIVGRLAQQSQWFDASTLKEPYRIEGKRRRWGSSWRSSSTGRSLTSSSIRPAVEWGRSASTRGCSSCTSSG